MYDNLARAILGQHRASAAAQIEKMADILTDHILLANLAKLRKLETALECLVGPGDHTIQLRAGSIYIGGFPTPNACACKDLMQQARAELKITKYPSAFAGLSILLIHPYSDGNGRMARLVWAAALLTREKATPTLICKHLHILRTGLQSNVAVQVQLAAMGDPAAFFRRWDASIAAAHG